MPRKQLATKTMNTSTADSGLKSLADDQDDQSERSLSSATKKAKICAGTYMDFCKTMMEQQAADIRDIVELQPKPEAGPDFDCLYSIFVIPCHYWCF